MEEFIILISIACVLILFVIILNYVCKKKRAPKTVVLTAMEVGELQVGDTIIVNGKKEIVKSVGSKTCITISNKQTK